MNTETR